MFLDDNDNYIKSNQIKSNKKNNVDADVSLVPKSKWSVLGGSGGGGGDSGDDTLVGGSGVWLLVVLVQVAVVV